MRRARLGRRGLAVASLFLSVLFAPAAAGADSFTVVSYARGHAAAIGQLPPGDRTPLSTDERDVAAARAKISAPAACSNDVAWLQGTGRRSVVDASPDGSVSASLTLTTSLCQAVTFELITARQGVVVDTAVRTVQAAGHYEWTATAGDETAFWRHDAIGPDGEIAAAMIDGTAHAEPLSAAPEAVAPVVAAPTRSALPFTGPDAMHQVLLGLILVAVGSVLVLGTRRVSSRPAYVPATIVRPRSRQG
ncbi:MAG: hypothetical protein ACOYNI_11875 [Acidimicrobiia bacterium]